MGTKLQFCPWSLSIKKMVGRIFLVAFLVCSCLVVMNYGCGPLPRPSFKCKNDTDSAGNVLNRKVCHKMVGFGKCIVVSKETNATIVCKSDSDCKNIKIKGCLNLQLMDCRPFVSPKYGLVQGIKACYRFGE